ncbi:MAG: hypothetical protein JW744_01930 [Candidatus Diapherotrites archaeon]|uniref:Thioredoxin domain-containing protein n=1 Tax=Candidatus Iainarchaeum sp. TaxID=3101447 RepID=A0A939C9Z7_9ARCH|nr:hypothetical protein [Candidatus Diapherotrites archaeon]
MSREEKLKSAIIMYHGQECPHCRAMMPLVQKLEESEGIKLEKKEVWHNEKNAEEMRERGNKIRETCGGFLGTPTFFSTKTGSALCGEVPYEKLAEWSIENI